MNFVEIIPFKAFPGNARNVAIGLYPKFQGQNHPA